MNRKEEKNQMHCNKKKRAIDKFHISSLKSTNIFLYQQPQQRYLYFPFLLTNPEYPRAAFQSSNDVATPSIPIGCFNERFARR